MLNFRCVLYALGAAFLFGASTPAAKALLGTVDPVVLAGLLYCGAGIGVALLVDFLRAMQIGPQGAQMRRADIPWLAAAITAGGMVGPVLLLLGLSQTTASTSSLLLTFEAPATAFLAWLSFNESIDRRIAFGMSLLTLGALVLAWSGTPTIGGLLGPLAIIGACLAWALDNNFTRKLSLSDPLQIVAAKGLVAGPLTLLLGLVAGGKMPDLTSSITAGVIGFLCYGVSLALYVRALRDLGAARTAAYFSVAPFAGAAIAVVVFEDPLTVQLAISGLLMAGGVWLHVTERHAHEHTHQPQSHSHAHAHDDSHSHVDSAEDPVGEPHTHVHHHSRVTHTHHHAPDMHHQHRH